MTTGVPIAPVLRGRSARVSWTSWWHSWRDRLLADRRFRKCAAAFPLTRPTARRHARELFDLLAGFVYSQVLFACVELDLFELLAIEPRTPAWLSERLGLTEDSTLRLLAAAEAVELVEQRGAARYGLGRLGAPIVGNEAVTAMVRHHAVLYKDLRDPVRLLRASQAERANCALARFWAYGEAGTAGTDTDRRVADYTELMSRSQPLVADEILDAFSLSGFRCLMDVGGGDGRFVESAAARWPSLRVVLFDLPGVAAMAEKRFAATGLADRAVAIGRSFFDGALPQGADVVSLVRVIHDHDDPQALAILRAVRGAMQPGDTLLLAEPMAGTRGAEGMGDAYFGFYLMAMGRGRPRTAIELVRMLRACGFEGARLVATRIPLQTQLLVARAAATTPSA